MSIRPTVLPGATSAEPPLPADVGAGAAGPVPPTVIGGGLPPAAPTVPASLQPTRLSASSAAVAAPPHAPPLTPTIFAPTAVPMAPFPVPALVAVQATATPAAPPAVSRVPGTRRAPLDVPRAELEVLFTGTDPAVIDELLVQMSHVVPDTMDTLDCEQLGRAQQQAYAAWLDRALAASGHASLRGAQRHLARLREILGSVSDQFDVRSWGWLRRKSARSVLANAQRELQDLKTLLVQAHDELGAVRQSLGDVMDGLAGLRREVLALVLLVELLEPRLGEAARPVLLDRGVSIAKTGAQIHQQAQLTRQTEEDVAELARTLHDAVWVQLPAWLSTVAALPEGEWSDTQRYLVHDSVQNFLLHLH